MDGAGLGEGRGGLDRYVSMLVHTEEEMCEECLRRRELAENG